MFRSQCLRECLPTALENFQKLNFMGGIRSDGVQIFACLSPNQSIIVLFCSTVYCQVQWLLSELGGQCCAEDGFKLEMTASKPALSFMDIYGWSYQELAKVALADLYACWLSGSHLGSRAHWYLGWGCWPSRDQTTPLRQSHSCHQCEAGAKLSNKAAQLNSNSPLWFANCGSFLHIVLDLLSFARFQFGLRMSSSWTSRRIRPISYTRFRDAV